VALGGYAWDAVLRTLAEPRAAHARASGTRAGQLVRPRFGHLAEAAAGPFTMIGSYHPSQQNTFTGRLTPEMLDDVLTLAVEVAGSR